MNGLLPLVTVIVLEGGEEGDCNPGLPVSMNVGVGMSEACG